jgi:hypothetical protein
MFGSCGCSAGFCRTLNFYEDGEGPENNSPKQNSIGHLCLLRELHSNGAANLNPASPIYRSEALRSAVGFRPVKTEAGVSLWDSLRGDVRNA